jgi:uncharacterized protein DUF998
MTRTPDRPSRLAITGLLAPVVFILAALAASVRQPGYDHLKNFVSELGATGAPAAGIMNFGGFLVYGLLMMAFAWAVHRGIRADAGGWLGPTVLALYGLAYVGVALAPCDPGCQAASPSLHHRLHLLLGELVLLTAVLSPFTLYARMVKDPEWRSLATLTLFLPGSAWVLLQASGLGVAGAIRQRVWLLLLFIWIELVALRLLRSGASSGRLQGSRAAV